jgi:hypothetical protein
MLFQPSQADVRRFFCDVYNNNQAAAQAQRPQEAIEIIASQWLAEHPEYHAQLADADLALSQMGDAEATQANPFLHLSMHLSITEQCSIDQPRGIRQAVELLVARCGDLHEAHHAVMECLGTMLWESQRSGLPPDGAAYVAAVQRRATQD